MFTGSIVLVGKQLSIILNVYVPADKLVCVYVVALIPNEVDPVKGDTH